MKTSNRILLFGFLGFLVVLLFLAIVFRMNSFRYETIAMDVHDTLHSIHSYHDVIHDSLHGYHNSLHGGVAEFKIGDHACYVNVMNKNMNNYVIQLEPFHSIVVGGKFHVVIKKGSISQITIKGEKSILPFVQTYVNNGTLKIKLDKDADNVFYKPINVVIETNNNIEQIGLGGENTLCVTNVETKDFSLNIGGELENCILTGDVENFSIYAGGKFNVNAKELQANNVNITMAGQGAAIIHVQKRISVTGFGQGTIYYYGNPSQVEEHGLGKIELINVSK